MQYATIAARWSLAVTATFLALMLAGTLQAQSLRAGSARRVVTPDLSRFAPVYLAGFSNNRVATEVHDDLFVRCLALQAQAEPAVLCSVDVIGLFFDDVQEIRELARAKADNSAMDLIVAVTHNHEGPDTMGLWGPQTGVSGLNKDYMDFLRTQIAETAAEAVVRLQPASATVGDASDQVLTASYDDTRPPVVHDDIVTVLHLTSGDGKVLGTLVNWNSHPESLGSKNTKITSDFLASFYRKLDQDEASVVFLNGALGGMQSPLGGSIPDPATREMLREPSFRFAEVLGERVAMVAEQAISRGQQVAVDQIAYTELLVRIPVSNKNFAAAAQAGVFGERKRFTDLRNLEAPVGFLRLRAAGEVVLDAAMIPGEAYPELSVGGIDLMAGADFPYARREKPYREMMKARYQMVVGLANDEIGYIIPKLEWDEAPPYLQNAEKAWYGEINSPGPETAPRIAEALEKLIEQAP
ncbi:MAG: hypothetical protein KIT83_09330 [Bryobacterales bacterium]|nr:hypothetical protein [Bryobacterales bacterium]